MQKKNNKQHSAITIISFFLFITIVAISIGYYEYHRGYVKGLHDSPTVAYDNIRLESLTIDHDDTVVIRHSRVDYVYMLPTSDGQNSRLTLDDVRIDQIDYCTGGVE